MKWIHEEEVFEWKWAGNAYKFPPFKTPHVQKGWTKVLMSIRWAFSFKDGVGGFSYSCHSREIHLFLFTYLTSRDWLIADTFDILSPHPLESLLLCSWRVYPSKLFRGFQWVSLSATFPGRWPIACWASESLTRRRGAAWKSKKRSEQRKNFRKTEPGCWRMWTSKLHALNEFLPHEFLPYCLDLYWTWGCMCASVKHYSLQ